MATRKKTQKHTTRAERALILQEFKASGLTQGAYAKQKGVNINTLVSWLRDARQGEKNGARAGRTTSAKGRFVEAAASSVVSRAEPLGTGDSLDALGMNELRALVRQQAAVIARFI